MPAVAEEIYALRMLKQVPFPSSRMLNKTSAIPTARLKDAEVTGSDGKDGEAKLDPGFALERRGGF